MYRLVLREPCKLALLKSIQQQNQRYLSGNGPHPNVREASIGKLLLLISPLVAAGGVITYAKFDKDFRKLVEKNVPGADSILKIVLQEEQLFKGFGDQFDSFGKKLDGVSKSINDAASKVTGYFSGSKKDEVKPKAISPKPVPLSTTAKSTPEPKAAPAKPAAKAAAATAAAATASAKKEEPLPKDILELEKAMEVSASLAVKEYNAAILVLKNFNEDVRNVVDQAVENMDTSLWNTLKNKTSARDSSVSTAEKSAQDAIEKLEKCEIALSKASTPANHDQILDIRKKVKSLRDHINKAKDELYKNKDISNMSEKYWRNVEKARNFFIDEIESIFPGMNMQAKELNLSKDDLDLFIMHAYSHVLAYQKELQRLQTDGELRLKRAIDASRGDNDSDAVKAQLEYHLEAERSKLAIENQKKIVHIRAESEKLLRQQLKQQAEAHVDHLKEAVNLKETEMKRNFTREMEDKLSAEKAGYKLQLAAMLGKMRGMDAALQARAESERSAHQAQALWAACQALWATVRTGEPGVHWREKLRPLKNEIKAVSKVAEGDELVAVVLQNLPREAEERGVFTEDALRERFLNVERVARKVALIPENGASLPMYLLSYMQSWFIMRPDDPISAAELHDQKFDYSKLDTYDILNRARFFVDRGDLLQALKYMNLLQGAPRKIASDWLKEARLLLETQQAANTLMAHAAASGLLYL